MNPDVPAVKWEVEIKRDGMWPTVWSWRVVRYIPTDYGHGVVHDMFDDSRSGDTFTKTRARKKALAAKRSMEDDDVKVTYN